MCKHTIILNMANKQGITIGYNCLIYASIGVKIQSIKCGNINTGNMDSNIKSTKFIVPFLSMFPVLLYMI